MSADTAHIRERVLENFESTRESPGSKFEPENFVHYLIANPDGSLNVHNSFKGKRYFVRFIQRVEVALAVCFSNNDLETLSGITKMTDRVAYLRQTPKSSLTVISNRLRQPFNSNLVISVAVLSFPFAAIFFRLFSFAGLAFLSIPALLILFIVRSHLRDRDYHQNLREQITQANETVGKLVPTNHFENNE